jgi:hypothetical protein
LPKGIDTFAGLLPADGLKLLPQGLIDDAAAHPGFFKAFQLRLYIVIEDKIDFRRHILSLLWVENNMTHHPARQTLV